MSKYLINDSRTVELRSAVVDMIRSSRQYIKTGNFLFQDTELIQELEIAMERGVALFILSNPKGADEMPMGKNQEGQVNTHIPNLKTLASHGAHCHFLDDLHAKFLVSDGDNGILMSANFAPTSLRGNLETGILLDKSESEELEYVFDILYTNADVYMLRGNEEFSQSSRSDAPVDPYLFGKDYIVSRLRLTLGQGKRKKTNLRDCHIRSLYDDILRIINEAEQYLYIFTWHFKELSHLPEFLLAINQAVSKGVDVHIHYNCKGRNEDITNREAEMLTTIGCKATCDGINHSKCVISEKDGIIFTANIDGESGLKSGFELGCLLTGKTLQDASKHVKSVVINSNGNS